MTQQLQAPVIIVGAGPAGAGTSIFLSKFGIPHIIIDKATFPRDKVCGDACSGKTLFVLRKANIRWVQEIFGQSEKYAPSKGIIFAAPNGKNIDIPFNGTQMPGEDTAGFTTPRLTFDHFLFKKLDKSFATIYEQATIKSIERSQDRVNISFSHCGSDYEVTSKIVIGADGDKSVVQKTFSAIKSSPKAYAVGLRAYYKGVTGMDKNNSIELHFLPEMLPGYFWIFPLPGGMANVGVGIPSERVRDRKINLRELMVRTIEENPSIRDRFKDASLDGKIQGWGLPMAIEPHSVSGDNYLLTGDAASLIDPFSGEGIGNALYSGMLAAEAVQKAVKEERYDAAYFKENYDDVLYRKIGKELQLSATLQRLCRFPWLFNMVVNKARKSPALRQTMSSMFSDLDLRAQLRKPSFYFRILFNR